LALLENGDPGEAEKFFLASLNAKSDAAAAHLGLARAQLRQNRLADGDPHFRRAAELDANYKDALLELADAYEKAGKKSEAIALYKESRGMRPRRSVWASC